MSKVFYYDSNEFTYPTWISESNSQELKSQYKKHFIKFFNLVNEVSPDMDSKRKEILSRIQAANIVNNTQTINSNF